MASHLGKMGAPPSAYATVVETYPEDLLVTLGRFRLRNDYGVMLYTAGKEDQAIAALEAALTVYKGTPRAGWDTVWERMYVVRNLGKMYAKKGASAASAAFANEWADEIEAQIARSPNQVGLRLGTAAALEALADLISDRDPARAARLRTVAAEEGEGEARFWSRSTNAAKRRCHHIEIIGTRLHRCFLELP